jgi:hypothetical protein
MFEGNKLRKWKSNEEERLQTRLRSVCCSFLYHFAAFFGE